jgi:hypothetical protein
MKKNYALVFLLFVNSNYLFATMQQGDIFIINGDTTEVFFSSLHSYFEMKGEMAIADFDISKHRGRCTHMWRGYYATWTLENDSLFLIRVQICGNSTLDIESEFGSNRVFAHWVTGTIACPKGEIVYYGMMSSDVFEDELYLLFEAGKLVRSSTIEILRNEMKATVLSSITTEERDSFEEDKPIFLFILFDENGIINFISWHGTNGWLLKPIAQRALEGFPQQMELMHERYSRRRFQILFTANELRNF